MASSDRTPALFLIGALLVGAVGCPAVAAHSPDAMAQLLPVWLAEGSVRATRSPALMSLPVGWGAGDAVAVIAPGNDWPEGLRDRLVAALLDSGAAVLELAAGHRGPPQPEAVAQDLVAALHMLREVEGAGLTVAIGFGEGGDAALAAARLVPAADGGLAAAVRLGPGAPVFLSGSPPAVEGWPVRAPLFCDLLAGAQPEAPGFAGLCRDRLAARR